VPHKDPLAKVERLKNVGRTSFRGHKHLVYSPPLGKMMDNCSHFDEREKKQAINPAHLDCEKQVAKVYRTEES